MRKTKHWLVTMAMLLCSVVTIAHDFEVDGIYYDITDVTNLTVEVTYQGTSFSSYSNEYTGAITIPSAVSYDGNIYSVTSIGASAFCGCSGLTAIIISDGVTSIESGAFSGCTSLISVAIPNTVTGISYYAFRGCSNLKDISIPSSVAYVGSSAFEDCTGLVSITIPCKSVGSYAFQGCANLSNVIIEKEVTDIAKGAFAECTSMKKLRFEEGTEILNLGAGYGYGEGMFYDCPLEALYLGRNLEYNTTSDYGYSPFCGVSELKSVIIGNCITSIGEYLFTRCSGLTSIICKTEVPPVCSSTTFNSVSESCSVSVPTSAVATYKTADYWKEFTSLKSIVNTVASGVCGNNLTWELTYEGELIITGEGSMNEYKYYELPWYDYKTTIEKVTISDGVISIGDNAFYGCSNITSISLPETIIEIGDYAFRECGILSAIVIPSSVTSIGEGAFCYCSNLISVTIPESVVEIGGGAFDDTAWYTSKPDGIIYIGNVLYEYKGAPSFGASIEIKEGTVSVCPYAFQGCSITSVAIPNSVESIGDYAFNGCNNLASITCDATNPPICFSSTFAYVDKTIPVYVPVSSVSAYNSESFWNEFTNVTRNDIVASGAYSNYYTWMLTNEGELIIEGTGDIIGSAYDEYRTSIRTITICDGITGIGNWAFENYQITSVTIPSSVTNIGKGAFYYCRNLTSITIPEGSQLTSIGELAFDGCESLTSITLPEGVTSIGDGAFSDCSSLTSITIPEGVTSIGESAFRSCSNLTSITLPEGVTSIGDWAFHSCSSLTSITLPEGVTSIGDYAFSGCSSLTAIIIPEGSQLTSIGERAFLDCSNLTAITIPEGVTSIGRDAFCGCISLTSITIPEGVTSIELQAFYGCSSLTAITIPESVTNIGDGAFSNCSSLTSITCKEKTPPVIGNSNTFYNVDKSIPVYVPASSVETYQAADYWSEFTNIQAIPEVITINPYGSATYCSEYALDFSEVEGLKAYAATGYNTKTGVVTLTRVMTSRPSMGLFLKGEPGEYTVSILESTDDNSLNMLVGTQESTTLNGTSADGLYYNYRYTIKDGDEAPLFYRIDDGYTLGAGKAYLQIPVADMKQNYVAPVIDVVEVEHESLMLTVSGETGGAGVGSGTAGEGPQMANERRGSWGSLWE